MKLKQLVGITLIAGAAIASTACHKHTMVVGAGGDTEADAAYNKWESHWFFGTIGTSKLDLQEVCPSGNATIKDKQSFLNGLVAGFVGIVWSPSTVTVYCGAGEAPVADETPATEEMEEESPEDEMMEEDSMEGEEGATNEVQIHLSAADMRRIAHDPRTLTWAKSVSSERAGALQAALRAEAGVDKNQQVAASERGASF